MRSVHIENNRIVKPVRDGKCPTDPKGHYFVTFDWIQKCGMCGYRRWLGLL